MAPNTTIPMPTHHHNMSMCWSYASRLIRVTPRVMLSSHAAWAAPSGSIAARPAAAREAR